jgi:ABC-type proline/glycine betaine transport system permease subunit
VARAVTRALRAVSPVVRAVALVLRGVSPVVWAVARALRAVSPVVRAVAPALRAVPPVVLAVALVLRAVSPVVRAVAPVLPGTAPVVRGVAPVVRAVSSGLHTARRAGPRAGTRAARGVTPQGVPPYPPAGPRREGGRRQMTFSRTSAPNASAPGTSGTHTVMMR